MGRIRYGPKMTWADFVMGRNDPEPNLCDTQTQDRIIGDSEGSQDPRSLFPSSNTPLT